MRCWSRHSDSLFRGLIIPNFRVSVLSGKPKSVIEARNRPAQEPFSLRTFKPLTYEALTYEALRADANSG